MGWLELWILFFEKKRLCLATKSHKLFSKYVLDRSVSIPIKNFNRKFLSLLFFDLWPQFLEKMALNPKKNDNGKFFWSQDFRFKIHLDHSESIPPKKFYQKFLFLPFSDQKWPKIEILTIFGQDKFFLKKIFTLFWHFLFLFFWAIIHMRTFNIRKT